MSPKTRASARPRTLAVDIGGSHIKAAILDPRGRPASERARVATPDPSTPAAITRAVERLVRQLPDFDRASVGFPGVIVDGRVLSAANLHRAWVGQHVVRRMRAAIGRPTRVANDADIQGRPPLPPDVTVVSNFAGITGGIRLWEDDA
ncbi:MAG: ROK family protein [Candidatus Eisenbacteria bacterium]|uniref:ROK family protein n=1 Tax=Eiseniibacteriota bacterium TaxID=2212470 RepID=A0A9D6QP15_UNCEI|nr:ROK family protein [Candidatus Eisenbacteria bacterium]